MSTVAVDASGLKLLASNGKKPTNMPTEEGMKVDQKLDQHHR